VKLIALAGLPGTGKSTLARALAPVLGAPVLDKDEVRAARFPPEQIEYSREQDDACMRAIHAQVEALAAGRAPPCVLLDGRTYSRREQVASLRDLAGRLGAPLLIVECVCDEATALERLARDGARGSHPAANRGPALHRRLAAQAEPIEPPKLVLDTAHLDLPAQVAAVLAELGATLPG